MKVSGFSILKNGVSLDFPFLQSIRSLLPLVDEMVIAMGDNDDNTLETLNAEIKDDKVKLLSSPWDPTSQKGGFELARQSNIALKACQFDLCFYLQGDEVLHEEDYPHIRDCMQVLERHELLDGVCFDWLHFYGNYQCIIDSPKRYRREMRLFKKSRRLQSYLDAQGFRILGKNGTWVKPRVLQSRAKVYHYGWVRPPSKMAAKNESFERLWHGKEKDGTHTEDNSFPPEFGMEEFLGTHPKVMKERIMNSPPLVDFASLPNSFSDSPSLWLRKKFEHITGWRPGEFTNYKIVQKI